tara:strand:- start:2862 stop:3188 length:327 start_codon:yes stop_codon:yes gene_type:complete
MKKKANEVVDKFFKFFEMNVFDPNNENHKKIVQKRINKMMESVVMLNWLKENILFGKDEKFTNEVLKYLIDCATSFYDEKEFETKIGYNSAEWIQGLDMRVSQIRKSN